MVLSWNLVRNNNICVPPVCPRSVLFLITANSAGRRYDKKKKKEVGCRAVIRACKSRRKNFKLWKITEAYLVHNNCTGEQENASLAAVEDMVAVLVRANPRITGPGIVKHLHTVDGINVHPRTALRAKAKALGRTDKRNKEGFTALQSLLDQLESTTGVHTNVTVSSEPEYSTQLPPTFRQLLAETHSGFSPRGTIVQNDDVVPFLP